MSDNQLPQPIINTHTHIFTKDDVPPYLGKNILPWPFYLIFSLPLIMWWYKTYKRLSRLWEKFVKYRAGIIGQIKSNRLLDHLFSIFTFVALLISVYFLLSLFQVGKGWHDRINHTSKTILEDLYALQWFFKVPVIIITALISDNARKLLLQIFKSLFVVFKWLPDNLTGTLKRYLMIARYAGYSDQKISFQKLYKMYPPGSKFVILPMDMTYLGAGTPNRRYIDQLDQIYKCRNPASKSTVPYNNLLPFVHVDPRRIEHDNHADANEPFFDWKPKQGGGVELKDCLLKRLLEPKYKKDGKTIEEEPRFCGIKIYPAQGYFPFDLYLLPLWLYCAEKGIPITTHCTVGTIYYRGKIQKEWLTHPVFTSKGISKPIPADTHHKLQVNFTHPLNYLVLLEDEYLKRWIGQIEEDAIKNPNEHKEFVNKVVDAFNYKKGRFKSLSKLKINLAHYGGSEEWLRFLEEETEESNQEIIERPEAGLQLLHTKKALEAMKKGEENPEARLFEKPSWIWEQKIDWYSIISAMMLQYKGVHADISYMLHSEEIYPLLQQTLKNGKLRRKVLFGTDFYVVRNHKSEKALYNEITSGLSESDIDQIGRKNPEQFLRHKVPG